MTKAAETAARRAREAALEKFEARFTKSFGEGSLTTEEDEIPYRVIPTGSLALDYALGVGGWVRGRISELWGHDDIGKGLLALQAVREAQRMYPEDLVMWIDMEQKWDGPWARRHGVDTTKHRFRLYTPESAEDVADAIKDAVKSGLFSFVVLDSIGAMIPEAEKEKDADEAVMMLQAKVVTRMVKIAAVEANKSDTAVLLINQVRADTSMSRKLTTTSGGFALKHATTHKVELKRGGDTPLSIKDGTATQQVGHQIAAFVDRNKVATAKRTAFVTVIYTETERYGPVGIDQAEEAATMGIKTGVIAQGGAWYTFTHTGERVKSRDTVIERLRNDPELRDEIREMVLRTLTDEVIVGEESEPEIDHDDPDLTEKLGEGTGMFRTGAEAAKEAVS